MADTKISGLTLVATPPPTTIEFAVNDSGTSKKANLAQLFTSSVFAAGTATAGSWPKLTVGTVLTTPEVGALELDANCLYGTTDPGNRGVIAIRHFIRADATRTYTSSTSSQPIFTSPANGRITLDTGLYRVNGLLAFTGMSATSGNLLITLVGGTSTATVSAWMMHAWGVDGAIGTAAAEGGAGIATSASPQPIVVATTGTALTVSLDGTFEVTGAGNMIPSLNLATASAAVLSIGSFLSFERMGSTSVVSVGQWD